MIAISGCSTAGACTLHHSRVVPIRVGRASELREWAESDLSSLSLDALEQLATRDSCECPNGCGAEAAPINAWARLSAADALQVPRRLLEEHRRHCPLEMVCTITPNSPYASTEQIVCMREKLHLRCVCVCVRSNRWQAVRPPYEEPVCALWCRCAVSSPRVGSCCHGL